jgi:adenylate kinase family enzyme
MGVKVFVLGRPGSGKSTAARHLNYLMRCQEWSVKHFNDYDILWEMFLADTEHKKFRPTPHNGFDATDFTVFDDALKELEKRVQAEVEQVNLLTIEFARDDYRMALKQFSTEFLQDSYFLFLDADIETCLRRVHERVEHAETDDDHPSFSDDIFRWYYARDNRLYMANHLPKELGIHKLAKVIDNTGPLPEFLKYIKRFANDMMRCENELLVPVLGGGR